MSAAREADSIRRPRVFVAVASFVALLAPAADAHEFAPGRLDIETTEDGFVALLAVPDSAPAPEEVRLVAPDGCRVTASTRVPHDRLVLTRARFVCDGPVERVEVAGLLRSHLDLFTQVDGAQQPLLRPAAPTLTLAGPSSVADELLDAVFARALDFVGAPAALLAALALGLFGGVCDRRFFLAALPFAFAAGYAFALPAAVAGALLLLGAIALAARSGAEGPVPRASLALLAAAAGAFAASSAARLDVALVEVAAQCLVWLTVVAAASALARFAPRRVLAPVVGIAAAFCLGGV